MYKRKVGNIWDNLSEHDLFDFNDFQDVCLIFAVNLENPTNPENRVQTN
jgi:hypothetical protein